MLSSLARAYEFDFKYQSKPNWETNANLLEFAGTVRRDLRDLRPRDMIDLQSFLWVQGSDESTQVEAEAATSACCVYCRL